MRPNPMRYVLITRPEPMASQLAEKLRREGMGAMIAPLSFFADEDAVMPDLAGFDALAFTSRYAVERFARLTDARHLPVFVVGSATAEAAHEAGFADVSPGGSDARDLAQVIKAAASKKPIKNILHPAGEDVARDLAQLLEPVGIKVTRLVLYRALLADSFPPDVASALKSGHITTVTLFSARAARRFAEILFREKLTDLAPQLEIACLSERIAAEVALHPWRSVKVSLLQNQESLMDCLRARSQDENRRQVMPVDVVLRAFGGIRPLSNRLGITASTVQGWKERGTIPETRINDILSAALKNGIDLDLLWDQPRRAAEDPVLRAEKDTAPRAEKNSMPRAEKDNASNRRAGQDRRRQPPILDARGQVQSATYQGQDRRSGIDRRAYQARQQRKVEKEKWRFFNRSVLMGAFFFTVISYAAIVLMAPELLQGKNPFKAVKNEVDKVINLPEAPVSEAPAAPVPQMDRTLEGKINAGIEKAEQVIDSAQQQASVAVSDPTQSLMQVLARATRMPQAQGGAFDKMIGSLQSALMSAPDTKMAREAQIQAVRGRDKNLDRVLDGVKNEDLEAAAILLLMSEFRSNVSDGRPFEQDLALVRKVTNKNAQLDSALSRLAPAAKTGVLSRAGLQKEFKSIAADIVVAKLKGEDAGAQQKILERLSRLVKVRKVDQVTGAEADAVVARAQIMLNQGNVDGAIAELQSLRGPSADAAAPFIAEAQKTQAAASDSDAVMGAVLSQYDAPGGAAMSGAFGDLIRAIKPRSSVPYLSPAFQR